MSQVIPIPHRIVGYRVVQDPTSMSVKPVLKRSEVLPGETYKIKPTNGQHALYVTINNIEIDGRHYPYEIFFNTRDSSHLMWTNSLTLLISTLFRQHIEFGLDLSFVIENLTEVYDPNGGYWLPGNAESKGRYVKSIVEHIGLVLKQHFDGLDQSTVHSATPEPVPTFIDTAITVPTPVKGEICPKCGAPALIKQSGCDTCMSCDYTKC